MIIVTVLWVVAGLVVIAVLAVAWMQEPPPAPVRPVAAHPRAAMRLLFVSVHVDHLVIDGLLDLDPPSLGVPTAWTFACPDHPVLAAATLDILERWADDGLPVTLDLSHVNSTHASVAFRRDDALVRLSPLPRHHQHEQTW